MSLPNARLTDAFVGICCCHPPAPCVPMSGIIVTSAVSHNVNNLGNARLTDIVLGGCGHAGIIITSSGVVQSENLHVARLSDAVGAGCIVSGIIVGGSGDVTCG